MNLRPASPLRTSHTTRVHGRHEETDVGRHCLHWLRAPVQECVHVCDISPRVEVCVTAAANQDTETPSRHSSVFA